MNKLKQEMAKGKGKIDNALVSGVVVGIVLGILVTILFK